MPSAASYIIAGSQSDSDVLTTSLSDLGGVVEAMVTDAVRAMKTRNIALARSVISRDALANQLQARIEDDAMSLLAQGRFAGRVGSRSLRRTMGAIRVASDLERIGDLAEGIAKRAINAADMDKPELSEGVTRMGAQVAAQLSAALDAFLRDDTRAALQVWRADKDTDALYSTVLHELLTHMAADNRSITAATALLFAARNLERVGDHTSNICEAIYFTANGTQLIDDAAVSDLLK